MVQNTFYDCPFPSFFSETKQSAWKGGAWNITFENNTLVIWNTRAAGNIFNDFISDVNLAEGQTYYLEGGKTYCMFDNLTTCKGFVLRTRPEDVAAGKRAKVLLGGMHMTGTNVNSMNLMFGRQPQAGEGGEIYMKMLEFYDIDFDCPMALTYGDNVAGLLSGSASGQGGWPQLFH